jgi:predicted ArsR family transcriptional regulator
MQVLAGAVADRVGGEDLEQPMAARLALAVKKLNGLHHQARWEAGPEGPRVIFAHCPYSAVIARHPELCAMDAGLLNALTGQPAQQTAKIGTPGSSRCVFQIGPNSAWH